MMLELQATPSEVMRAVDALQVFAQQNGVPEKHVFGLALALEECSSNIVNHALKRDARLKFRVRLQRTSDAFIIELRDEGPEFDPLTVERQRFRAEDDDTPGGWGIKLVRHYIDEISYARREKINILRLIKRLTSSEPEEIKPQQITIITNRPDHAMALDIQIPKSLATGHTGTVTVKLAGSLDTDTSPRLERELAPILAGDVTDIVFDLAQLKFISSAGLRVFGATRNPLKARGGKVSFVNVQPQIQEVFEIIKALPGVTIFESMDEMDRYLAARQRAANPNP